MPAMNFVSYYKMRVYPAMIFGRYFNEKEESPVKRAGSRMHGFHAYSLLERIEHCFFCCNISEEHSGCGRERSFRGSV